jgi:hypothetical protein
MNERYFADQSGEIVRRPVASPYGIFTVVIPEIKGMETLTFHGVPAGGAGHHRDVSQEVARFDLRPILRQKGGYRQRRVSTTLRQVFAEFSEFFMCWSFPQKISRQDRLATTIAHWVDP